MEDTFTARKASCGAVTTHFKQDNSDRINKLVAKANIGNVHNPTKMNVHPLRPAKDGLGRKVPSICHIPCDCNKVNSGQTGDSIKMWCKKHA
jgi:hypothetical protein